MRKITKTTYLRRLAKLLTYKADIYGPQGRIFSFEAQWRVEGEQLFHGDKLVDPDTLRDGHGNLIIA